MVTLQSVLRRDRLVVDLKARTAAHVEWRQPRVVLRLLHTVRGPGRRLGGGDGLQGVVLVTGVAGGQAERPLVDVALTVSLSLVVFPGPPGLPSLVAPVDLGDVAGGVVVAPVGGGVGLAGRPGGCGGCGDANIAM